MRLYAIVCASGVLCLWGAAELLRGGPNPAAASRRIAGLVEQLGDDKFAKREQASKELESVGEPALNALQKAAADSRDLEIRTRATRLVRIIRQSLFVQIHRLGGYDDIVWMAAVSPDGKRIVAAGGGDCINGQWVGGSDFAVRVWDAQTGKEVKRLDGNSGPVLALAWSADGKRLFFNNGDSIRVWDMKSGKERTAFMDAGSVVTLSLSADGKRLLTGGWDRTVRLWDVAKRKEVKRFTGHTGRVWDVALSPDGKKAASCGDERVVRIWDVETGKEERKLHGHINFVVRVVFSADGKQLLSSGWDNTARLWNPATGAQVAVFRGHTGRVEGIAFCPGGKRILTGSLDGTVRLWDPAGKLIHTYEGHTGPVARVAFAPDGRWAVSAGWDKTARVWRMPAPSTKP